jgi:hypothetical protein
MFKTKNDLPEATRVQVVELLNRIPRGFRRATRPRW